MTKIKKHKVTLHWELNQRPLIMSAVNDSPLNSCMALRTLLWLVIVTHSGIFLLASPLAILRMLSRNSSYNS